MKRPVLPMSVVFFVEVAGCVPATAHSVAWHSRGVWCATVAAQHAVHEAQAQHAVHEVQAPAISVRECGDLAVGAQVGTCFPGQPRAEEGAQGQPEEHGPKHYSPAVAGEHQAAHEWRVAAAVGSEKQTVAAGDYEHPKQQ